MKGGVHKLDFLQAGTSESAKEICVCAHARACIQVHICMAYLCVFVHAHGWATKTSHALVCSLGGSSIAVRAPSVHTQPSLSLPQPKDVHTSLECTHISLSLSVHRCTHSPRMHTHFSQPSQSTDAHTALECTHISLSLSQPTDAHSPQIHTALSASLSPQMRTQP